MLRPSEKPNRRGEFARPLRVPRAKNHLPAFPTAKTVGLALSLLLALPLAFAARPLGPDRGKCDLTIPVDVKAGRFDETAQSLSHASGCFVESDLAITGPIRVHAVRGRMSRRLALARAIRGTRLRMKRIDGDRLRVYLVKAR